VPGLIETPHQQGDSYDGIPVDFTTILMVTAPTCSPRRPSGPPKTWAEFGMPKS
jgi:hypothetical protein